MIQKITGWVSVILFIAFIGLIIGAKFFGYVGDLILFILPLSAIFGAVSLYLKDRKPNIGNAGKSSLDKIIVITLWVVLVLLLMGFFIFLRFAGTI